MKKSISVQSLLVRCVLLFSIVAFFSVTFFRSQRTQANIEATPSSPRRALAALPTALPEQMLQSNSADQDLQGRLTEDAFAYLKAEHDIKLTGQRPTRQLVARYDGEQHRERAAEERISAGLRLYEHYRTSVRRLRNIDVTLMPSAVRVQGDKTLLQAIEHTTYHYNVSPGVALPDTSEDEISHVFVFRNRPANSMRDEIRKPSLVVASYSPRTAKKAIPAALRQQQILECDPYGNCMIYDSTGCDPYGYYPCADPSFDNSTYCCYTEEAAYDQPFGAQPLDPYNVIQVRASAGCDYRGADAGFYAWYWAFGYNSSYRTFQNDCTNFVSQALYNGGWLFKHFRRDYKNWGLWWYDAYGTQNTGQTRSWTQARALEYFIWNSGRGYNTTSICDLDYGDVVVVDWENNGSIDHAMVVTEAVNCTYGGDGLLLSQHSPGRRDKSLSEYLREVPTAKFHAYWICHNYF
jgi:Putative amidase domain